MVQEIPLPESAAVLVLSPHLDDALFSAFELLAETKAEVWTVFAGSPEPGKVTAWDVSQGFETGHDLVRARLEEDRNAFARFAGKVHQLSFLERAYTNPAQRENDLYHLAQMVNEWVESQLQHVYIFVPAGAGVIMPPPPWQRLKDKEASSEGAKSITQEEPEGVKTSQAPSKSLSFSAHLKNLIRHSGGKVLHQIQQKRRGYYQGKGMLANEDHLVIRDLIIERFLHTPGVTVGFYEELPYLWSQRADHELQRIAEKHDFSIRKFEKNVNQQAKFSFIQHYTTQITSMDPVEKRLLQPETLPSDEMYWLSYEK